MALILPRNPLTYPGGVLPGVNPNHPALAGGGTALLHFSGVAMPGGKFTRLDRAEIGTYTAGVTGAMHGFLGPAVYANAVSDQIVYTNVSSFSPPGWTFAAILTHPGTGGSVALSTGQSGFSVCNGLQYTGSAWQGYNHGNGFTGGGVGSRVFCALGDPIFVVISQAASGGQFAGVVNLRTGARATTTQTTTNTLAGAANVTVLNAYTGSNGGFGPANSGGVLAAAALINVYMTSAVFMQWAQDPWSFWYPSTFGKIPDIGSSGRPPVLLASNWPLNVAVGLGYTSSAYDQGLYGQQLYSHGSSLVPDVGLSLQEALADVWSLGVTIGGADLQLAARPPVELAGSLNLQIGLAGTLSEEPALAGAWALNIGLSAQATLQETLGGSWSLSVVVEPPDDLKVIVAPLWGLAEPCPTSLWTPMGPCPNPPWVDQSPLYRPDLYGVGAYGVGVYSEGYYDYGAGVVSPWVPAQLCRG